DTEKRHAADLQRAIRGMLADCSRPAAERARLFGLADALDRVVLALRDASVSAGGGRALAGASDELRVALTRARDLLDGDVARRLASLNASLDPLAAVLDGPAARGGSALAAGPGSSAPAAASNVPIAEAVEPVRFGASAPQSARRGE